MKVVRQRTHKWHYKDPDTEEVELYEAIKENVIDHSSLVDPAGLDRLIKLVTRLTEKLIEHNLFTLDDLNEVNYTYLKAVGDDNVIDTPDSL